MGLVATRCFNLESRFLVFEKQTKNKQTKDNSNSIKDRPVNILKFMVLSSVTKLKMFFGPYRENLVRARKYNLRT